jgi:xanthine dehydrogenase accessory factor
MFISLMNRLHKKWMFIQECIKNDAPVILLYVLESKGSSPGRQGFFMAVAINKITDEFSMKGSIGGGIMEHKFVELAKEKLKMGNEEFAIRKQVHDKSAAKDQSGMICSGEQTILLYPVQEKDIVTIQRLILSLEQNENGTLTFSSQGMSFDNAVSENSTDHYFQAGDNWLYKEKTGYKNKLFIIGGGHCSLALSNLMRSHDFYIQIFDDRKGLKTLVENEAAHEKCFVDSYDELERIIPPGNNHYVVVMTIGYRTDDIAVRALLQKRFKYFGVLGSKKKMQTLFDEYKKNGVSEELLQRIHTPIGLSINSQTPEEIAVSIAAEIIKVKNQL